MADATTTGPATPAASDPTSTQAVTGAAAGGNDAQGLAQAIAALAAVATSLNETTKQLSSMTESLNKANTGSNDQDTSAHVVKSDVNAVANFDPNVAMIRSQDYYAALQQQALVSIAGMFSTALTQMQQAHNQYMRHADIAVAGHWGAPPSTAANVTAPKS